MVDESKRVLPNEKKEEQPKLEIPAAAGTDMSGYKVEAVENRMKGHTDITTIEYFVFPNYKSEEVPYVKGIGQISHIIGIMSNPLYKEK